MKERYLETGEIVSTHGIRGEVKIYPWADSPEFLLQLKELRIGGTLYRVSSARIQKTCVLAKLAGVDSIEAAQPMIGKTVEFDRTIYTPDSGWFIADLIGLEVRCDGKVIGKLKDILQMPGNDVWVVKGSREYLIPSVPEFIHKVDPDAGYAEVKLLEGMATDEN